MVVKSIDRRTFLQASGAAIAGTALLRADEKKPDKEKLTQFQIACMTLPYSAFPLERALSGIKDAGY